MGFFLVGIAFLFILFLAPFLFWGFKRGKIRRVNFIIAKDLYEKVLMDLQSDPENVELRVKTLQLGRDYYAYLYPELCSFDSDERPLRLKGDSTQIAFHNNAETIEIKIQSDLQARTGKGKVS